ncbi:MAG: TetR/AcrR family transcriptional regulator [Lachnospiraceae bacterium]
MKEDQRIRLSKQLLRNALISLLEKKTINKISVREICETAEINRTTFYKYYGSPYDLLEDIENILLNSLSEKINKVDSSSYKQLPEILEYLNENCKLFRLLINNNADPEFPRKILNLPVIKENIYEMTGKSEFAAYPHYTYEFFISGGYSVIQNWLNKENRESPEEMADYIRRLFTLIGSNG